MTVEEGGDKSKRTNGEGGGEDSDDDRGSNRSKRSPGDGEVNNGSMRDKDKEREKYVKSEEDGNDSEKVLQVLMISSSSGPGLLFPKGGWENDETVREAAVREAVEEAGVRGILMDFLGDYEFRSKTHQDECSPEGLCKAAMYALYVKEELETWPEKKTRTRTWLTIEEAVENCRHAWMKEALVDGFCKWHKEKLANGEEITDED